MSSEKYTSQDDEYVKGRTIRSNYFQTEFTVSFGKENKGKSFPKVTGENVAATQPEKKSISVQVDRNIIGQEKMIKERKKWIRPPLVGQASTSSDVVVPAHQDGSSDSDGEIIDSSQPSAEPTNFASRSGYPNRKSYINEIPPEGAIGDPTEISPVLGNPCENMKSASPTSSVTSSRPLEWDSGADVGYGQFYAGRSNEPELSTLERLALQRGSATLLTRSDPEGTTGSSSKQNLPIGSPNAESTPVNTITKNDQLTNRGYHLFPEVIVVEHQVSDSDLESNNDVKTPVKKCSSLEAVTAVKPNDRPATFPRSQSQSNMVFNINSHLQKMLSNPKSNSSSSVATVVIGGKKNLNHSPESETSAGDRVNSFEYLPGNVYESNSNGIVLINGQDFKQDVDRGVRLLAEFVKDSNANNTLMRKELLHQVVEGLISAEYLSDRDWSPAFQRCVTRRRLSRDRNISGESSTVDHDDDQPSNNHFSTDGSLVASQETKTNDSHHNTDSKSSGSHFITNSNNRKCQLLRVAKTKNVNRENQAPNSEQTTDLSNSSSSDWKKPVTKSERIFEAKKAAGHKAPLDGKLLQYLYSERENQIDWIRKEISHLSNLKQLLERHESLRKNFATLKNQKKLRARSADNAGPAQRSRKKPSDGVHSAPVLPDHNHSRLSVQPSSVENVESLDSDYNSHNYDTDRGDGIMRRHASTHTGGWKWDNSWHAVKQKKSLAYTIVFEPNKENEDRETFEKSRKFVSSSAIADREALMKTSRHKVKEQLSKMSLQDELLTKRPDYVAKAESRRQIVAELTALRELRQQHKANVLAAAVADSNQHPVPPPPLEVKRVVSQRAMRSLTERKYKQTFEVLQKRQDVKRKEDYRTNRLMAQVFKKKLQKRTLKGETDLSNSVHVISNSL